MRFVLFPLLLFALPATAWEFTPYPVCTLRHEGFEGRVVVTHEAGRPEPWAIAVTRAAGPWPEAPAFGIRFEGDRPLTIGTTRHRPPGGGDTLTVTDTGFGNLLDGLAFNRRATAFAGGAEAAFDLQGAAGPVAALRACAEAPPSS